MDKFFNWGYNCSQFPTSNSEYGRIQKLPKPDTMGSSHYGGFNPYRNNAAPVYNGQFNSGYGNNGPDYGQMYMDPGHVHQHQPNCPNYKGGQTDGSSPQLTGSGTYDTGRNSPTDFQVLVGDAAAAELAKNGSQSQSTGGANAQSNDPIQQCPTQGSGDYQSTAASGDQIQLDSYDAPKQMAMPNKTAPTPQAFVKMTGLRPQKESKSSIAGSMPNPYSFARGDQRNTNHQFYLCGKCQKCQTLKDPNSEINQKATSRRRLYKAPLPSARSSQPGKK